VNAREQAAARDQAARQRLAGVKARATLTAADRLIDHAGALEDALDRLESVREELVDRLDAVEALLVRPGKHWQQRAGGSWCPECWASVAHAPGCSLEVAA
jgi:chloramphenicol 3-O-phosphotransferase